MMKAPLISICVQAYNQQEYITQCLEGILMQKTDFRYEIILGEDQSTDNTRQICKDYAAKYPDRIKLFLRSRKDVIFINDRPSGRFNFIENLKAARGKYIAICEGDDYWTDSLKLQRQVNFLEANPNYAICFHPVIILEQELGSFIEDSITKQVKPTTDIHDLAKGNYIHTPSVVFRNQFKIPKWFKNVPIGDWCLYMILIGDKSIKRIDQVMAVYRKHEAGIWSTQSQEYRNEKTRESIRLMLNHYNFSQAIKKVLIARSGTEQARKEFRGKYFIKHIFKSLYLKK